MYDSAQKKRWDNQAVLEYAVKEAKQEGHFSAMAEVALEMKSAGRPLNEIARFTKLSIEEIERL